jgi:hypothetical protein
MTLAVLVGMLMRQQGEEDMTEMVAEVFEIPAQMSSN